MGKTERCSFFHTTFNRKVTNQGEILNCDLTEKNTSKLDPYNNDHFIVNALTDFYDRLSNLKGNCDFISGGGGQTEKMDTTGGAGDLLPFSGGNDVVTFPAFTTTAATPNTAVVSIETDAFQGSVSSHRRHHR